jgi:hypothetical protein
MIAYNRGYHLGISIIVCLLFSMFDLPSSLRADDTSLKYIVVNQTPGMDWARQLPKPVKKEKFDEVRRALVTKQDSSIRVGIGFIFSYFRSTNDELLTTALRSVLEFSKRTDTPVLIQLDGENWWQARPDLWNWWDPDLPGYNPANRNNVEWYGWKPDDALKIAWRNWGKQLRVLPPPNLMSPRYRAACHERMQLLIPIVLDWWHALPEKKKDLLIGIKVGWESSIGVNAWYYPNGNALRDRPKSEDPTTGLDGNELPGRGVTPIGYAAVKTAGIRDQGDLTEADLAEVARRHLEDLSREAARLGVPRERLFTHGAAWKDDELLYDAAVNSFSCPGWSFYKHAKDPRQDTGIQRALQQSDAPFWAATEWLYQGKPETIAWREALENTLAAPRCRYVCIYNWEIIREKKHALEAIRQTVAARIIPESKKSNRQLPVSIRGHHEF